VGQHHGFVRFALDLLLPDTGLVCFVLLDKVEFFVG
jgi:hypothetical protein